MATRFPRIRLTVPGIGLVQIATGAKTAKEHERRKVVFDELVADSQLDVIRALIAGTVKWPELIEARRRKELRGSQVLASVALNRDLASAVTETLPKMGKAKATRKRYAVTWRQIAADWKANPECWLPEGHEARASGTMKVRDLAAILWGPLHDHWRARRSAADWNHVARFVSGFLSKYLGHKHHAFALEVRALLPRDAEDERIPDITPEVFERIMQASAEHVRPAWMCLLLLGCRVRQEYLTLDRATQLMPERHAVRFRGTGTNKSKKARLVAVDPEFWPWINAGVPSPLKYKRLRRHWIRACVAVGAGSYTDPEKRKGYVGLRLHDLRHALGQWATDAGIPLERVRDVLGHTNLATTARYARVAGSSQVGMAIGNALRKAK